MAVLEWLGGPKDGEQFLIMEEYPPHVYRTAVPSKPTIMEETTLGEMPHLEVIEHMIVMKAGKYYVIWGDYDLPTLR